MVDGWRLMVDGLCSPKELNMNILHKLTDGLNHPVGIWLMAHVLSLQPRAERASCSQMVSTINWFMVDGSFFSAARSWVWTSCSYMVQPTLGIWLKVLVDGIWLMFYDFYRSWAWTSCLSSQMVSTIQWFLVDGLCSLFCSQEVSMNILPELSDGLNLLLDALVKSSFVIEKQPPQVTTKNK